MKFGTGHATQVWYQLQATSEAYSSTLVSLPDVWVHIADDLQGNGSLLWHYYNCMLH